jgi:hypothetical protein
MSRVTTRTSAPAVIGSVYTTGQPRISYSPNGDAHITHKEYIADVLGSISFSSIQYPIQVGSGVTFEWLNAVVRRFERYRFRKLNFCYETSCSTTTAGEVMLIPDYDASDSAPGFKAVAMAYRDATRSQCWQPSCMRANAESLRALPAWNVGSGSVVSGQDIKMSNVGNLFLCVQGTADNTSTLGELYVEYEVDLMTPTRNPALVSSSSIIGATSISAAAPFGTAPTFANGALSLSVSGSGASITFNEGGTFLVTYNLVGTVLVAPTVSLASAGGGVAGAVMNVVNTAATSENGYFTLKNIQPGTVMSLVTSGSGTITGSTSFVTPYFL